VAASAVAWGSRPRRAGRLGRSVAGEARRAGYPGGADASRTLGAVLGQSYTPLLFALAAAALFGAATPLCKPLLAELAPTTLAGLLYLGAAAALAPVAWRDGLPSFAPSRANLARLAGIVIFGGALAPVLLLAALARAPAGSVALWLNLEVAATALLARVFFREHLTTRGALAILLVCAASALLAIPTGAGGAPAPALLLVAAACLCWALDNNWTSRIDAFTPAQSSCAKGLVAGSVNLALGLAGGDGLAPANAGLALAIGAACYGLSLALLVSAAQQLGAARSQLAFATASFWGVALAWLLLGEPVLAVQLASAAAMALALVLIGREQHGHWHQHEAVTHRHAHRHDDGHHDHSHPEALSETWHSHAHRHDAQAHAHPHRPDLHHRHPHRGGRRR
jgi:drug/metabolite transporter (DMT)-like permease